MDIVVEVDCGNAPRKAQIRDWLIALEGADNMVLAGLLAADVVWERVGEETWRGSGVALANVPDAPARSLRVSSMLSHGKQVAAEGSVLRADGSDIRFAHIITFSGHGKAALIESVVTYESVMTPRIE